MFYVRIYNCEENKDTLLNIKLYYIYVYIWYLYVLLYYIIPLVIKMTSFIEGNVEISSKYPMLGFQILILFIYKYSPYRRYHVHKYKQLFNGSKQHGEESSQKAIKATLGRVWEWLP